ncbi:anti-sigma factor [Paraburkholderia sp. J12]|uniref:anti-sigma factor n=1 Tax=Paraburkholderia sp. J12 TaxID=2805432 RepID=UPI002ABD8C77|nr:anti-sigma factor [Paraburkholderia sp. J12]
MKITSLQLLDYVEGRLTREECVEVERLVATSPEIAKEVRLLRASQLPYVTAFEHANVPPLPDSLRTFVEAQAALRRNTSAKPDKRALADQRRDRGGVAAAKVAPHWLGAAFAAGLLVAGVGLHVLTRPVEPPASLASSWVAAAAGYQALYTRDTLAHVSVNDPVVAQTVAEIHRDDGLAIAIPDLRPAGLTFKRIQRLRFQGRPLVQIVYLPQQGAPVALCVMQEAGADASPRAAQVDSMAVVTWRRNQLGYALIGDPDAKGLTAIAKQIADGGFEPAAG